MFMANIRPRVEDATVSAVTIVTDGFAAECE